MYKLSATLSGHTSDVRAVDNPTDDLILSASRDSTAIVWRRDSTGAPFASDSVIRASTRYVNSVAYLPPTTEAPKGYAVTGDLKGVINVFSLEPTKDDPDYTLLGHTGNVCGLRTTAAGSILSCSWDSTARVWTNFSPTFELKGHENSVWDAVAIDEDEFITGSADKTIKLWKQHKVVHTFTGHDAVVRCLAVIPDIGFASCADNEIRVWSLGGDHLYTLSGHTSFIYRLAVLPSGDLVSSGEDRTVRVWKGGECVQILVHPATSVWAVSTMPNGDIVSGSSDRMVRVFSASADRWASEEDIKAYHDIVAQQALPAHDVDEIKVEGMDALNTPGQKIGQTKIVLNGDISEVYQWDRSNWQKIGERAKRPNNEKSNLFEGKLYEYVWDVALEDDEPSHKLPYNISETPQFAAQRFLERYNLPLAHVDTIVDFILRSTYMAKNAPPKMSDVPTLAKYISSDKCQNIVLMIGAGVSTSAGIPDFRSPETGLYANLARLNLPYPEAVFDINFFRKNPVPFYTLAHELYPGKFRPTLTHSFIRLLAAHGLLHTCFTQNIDTLERRAGVPDDKIVEAHGSFASQRCIDCQRTYDDAKMKRMVLDMQTPKCETCGGLVKPDIVFFGEALPDDFINAIPNVAKADLLIIMGTSMKVHPFAGLAERTTRDCPRVLINLDAVGSIGWRPADWVLLGKCDDVVRDLCKELGWEKELLDLWEKTELKEDEVDWEAVGAKAQAGDVDDVPGAVGNEAPAEDPLVAVITAALEKQLDLKPSQVEKDATPSVTKEEPEVKEDEKEAAPTSTDPGTSQSIPTAAPEKF